MINNWLKNFFTILFEKRIAKKHLKDFYKSIKPYSREIAKYQLSKEEKKEIKSFFKRNLGSTVDTIYHTYFKRNGISGINYIPTYIYRSKIIYRLNDFRMKDAYIDKNIYDKLFLKKVNQPKTIIRRINGLYYNGEYEPLSYEEAIRICSNQKNVIIKPSLESAHGNLVKLFSSINGIVSIENKRIEEFLDIYGNHFLIQEKIVQHEQLSKLNPTSINTIRVLTYRRSKENDIAILYTVIRIGRKNQIIDNESSGGISAKIDRNGQIGKYAFSIPGTPPIKITDSGCHLEGHKIPSFNKIISTCKILHQQLPYFNLVGWDMTVDVEGEPLLIEWNVSPDLSQSANGPAFGDYTEEILQHVKRKESTRFIKLTGKGFTQNGNII